MAQAEEAVGVGPRPCPRCGHGTLRAHHQPRNYCGWWICDFPCGYGEDVITGWSSVNFRRGQAVDSGNRGNQDDT